MKQTITHMKSTSFHRPVIIISYGTSTDEVVTVVGNMCVGWWWWGVVGDGGFGRGEEDVGEEGCFAVDELHL